MQNNNKMARHDRFYKKSTDIISMIAEFCTKIIVLGVLTCNKNQFSIGSFSFSKCVSS